MKTISNNGFHVINRYRPSTSASSG